MYKFQKNGRLFVKGSRENDDPDAVHQDLIHDSTVDKVHYENNSKNQMASASQETRELFRTFNDRNGLRTVHTTKASKKTTTVNRGEQKKLVSLS